MSYSYQLKKTNIVKIFSLFIKLPRIFKLFFFIVFSSNSKLTEEKKQSPSNRHTVCQCSLFELGCHT